MKTIIFAVVFVGLMSAQFYGAAAPQVGQVYRWDSDTPFGVVPKTQLTVIEVYGSGVKLKDATGNEYTINNSMFHQYLGLQMLVSVTPKSAQQTILVQPTNTSNHEQAIGERDTDFLLIFADDCLSG